MLLLVACQEEEEKKTPSLNITDVEPGSGLAGTEVIIHGTGFQTDPTKNTVMFFDNIATEVLEATTTTLKVIVPEGATTGEVSVTVNSKTAISNVDFVIPPHISDFSPKSGVTGIEVTITGTGFSSTNENNEVTFNNTPAVVIQSAPTSITVEVPVTGSSGKITVKVGDEISTSADNFIFHPHIGALSASLGAVNKLITITGSGFSTILTENIVSFNGITTPVLSGDVNSLNVLVPPLATSGIVTLTTSGALAEGPFFEVVVEAMHAGSANYENGYGIAVDQAGNTYVTGSFVAELTFGNTTLQPQGEDIFVVKYNDAAEVVWAKKIGDVGSERGMSIATDNTGNCYVGGYSLGDAFIAQLDADGNISWSSIYDTNGSFSEITVQGDNLYATGGFSGSISIGSSNLVSTGTADIIITKFNKDTGATIWAKNFGSTEYDSGDGIVVSSNGSIYISGSTFGTMTIGSTTLTAQGGLDAFIMKLDQDGNAVWAKSIAGSDWENALGVALDESGNPVVTGYFTNSVTIGSTVLSGAGNEDIFLTKLDATNGNVIWAVKAGGTNYDNGRGITSDAAGNIYLTGYFEGSATFGSTSIPNTTNSRDVFVAKYNTQGEVQWVKHAGGNESDGGEGIAVSQHGIVHVTGSYRMFDTTFGSTELTNAGGDDIFIWKIWP